MRQTLKERRKQLHRGMPMPRLLTMVLMMAIMALIFVRLRDPATWRWFSRDTDDLVQVAAGSEPAGTNPAKTQPAAPASSAAPAETPADLTPTGSTDLDPMEWDDMKTNVSLIEVGSLEMNKLEMPAYFRVLNWVDHQPTALLRKRAHKDVVFNDFRKTPNSMRLQIVELKLNVRQILRAFGPPENGKEMPITTPEGKQIYQVCGFTQEGGSNMYYGIVTDLPKGMPIGTLVNEDAKLVGYFFKLQGYISQAQQLEAERTRKNPIIYKAPVIIGRLIWIVSPTVAEDDPPVWLFWGIGGIAVLAIVGWVLLSVRRSRRHAIPAIVSSPHLETEAFPVDSWLDEAQSGRLASETGWETTGRSDKTALDGGFGGRLSGNIFWENGESKNGHGANNGRRGSAEYGTDDENRGSGSGSHDSGNPNDG